MHPPNTPEELLDYLGESQDAQRELDAEEDRLAALDPETRELYELLREVAFRGVSLVFPKIGRDWLKARPAKNLTPELVAGLKKHKPRILQMLEETTPVATEDEVFEAARSNFWRRRNG